MVQYDEAIEIEYFIEQIKDLSCQKTIFLFSSSIL